MIPVDKGNPASQQVRVDMSTAKDVKCTQCGHVYFTPSRRLKFISKIVSPNGQDLLIPVEVLLCTKCGSELDPERAVANVNIPEIKVTNDTQVS